MTAVIQRIAEGISLGLTVPTVVFSAMVVVMFFKSAIQAIKRGRERDAIDWLKLGIWIGFVGSSIDNIYWGFAWSCSFVGSSLTGWAFNNGVYFNIPFRQLSGILAAYCHVRCAVEMTKGKTDLRLWITTGLGAVYVGALVLLKAIFKFK